MEEVELTKRVREHAAVIIGVAGIVGGLFTLLGLTTGDGDSFDSALLRFHEATGDLAFWVVISGAAALLVRKTPVHWQRVATLSAALANSVLTSVVVAVVFLLRFFRFSDGFISTISSLGVNIAVLALAAPIALFSAQMLFSEMGYRIFKESKPPLLTISEEGLEEDGKREKRRTNQEENKEESEEGNDVDDFSSDASDVKDVVKVSDSLTVGSNDAKDKSASIDESDER